METREPFRVELMGVSVEESAEALTYTFTPPAGAFRPAFPLGLTLPLVAFPLAMLALVGYAYANTANRPEWEQVLTGVFVAQMIVWLVTGTLESVTMLRWTFRSMTTVLKFTRTHVWHAGDSVCELEEVRGLRLFTYPVVDDPGRREACLSLVIGEDGGTHGLFGGFEEQQLRTLAEDLHRRLTAFRFNQGIMASLEPLSVVETTADDASNLMHTRPPRRGIRLFASGVFDLLTNPWAGSAWCLAMFAGLYGSGRLVAASGLPPAFLLGHGLAGFVHFALIMGIWGQPPQAKNAEKTS